MAPDSRTSMPNGSPLKHVSIPETATHINQKTTPDQTQLLSHILIAVSVILVSATLILKLDYIPGVLLGCSVIGLNFHWTVRFVRILLLQRKIQGLHLLFYLLKFALSALVLYGALNFFQIEPLALLIGLSNIVLAVVAYSVITALRIPFAPESTTPENKE